MSVVTTTRKIKSTSLNVFVGDKHESDAYFRLPDSFLKQYRGTKPKFGFNGMGEFVFYRTYSRIKENGEKESFFDTIKRVVEGCYEIQRRHCAKMHIPWDYDKAVESAQEMFVRMWEFKFLPPGRGLWMMGTKFMWERGSSALNNCGFVSTDDKIESDPAEPFCFLMDMSMLGVGVGFDTKGANKIVISAPNPNIVNTLVVDDSREGWVDSVRKLIHSYTTEFNNGVVEFDYSQIRPPGSTINGFGGKASGPSILLELHDLIKCHLNDKVGSTLSSVDITDIMNYIGKCVVAGNVRRCLPKGTLVHLKRGLVPIENVHVGDLVLTSDGYYTVTENVYQGVQNVLTIKTQMGQFRCTEKHRIAVLTDIGVYDWKRANQLSPGDKMVFVDDIIPGVETTLPGYSSMSTKGTELVIPSLTEDVAWFIGYVHGDGYVYPGRVYRGRKHHGASVSVPINNDEYYDAMLQKIENGFLSFGNFNIKDQPTQDNCDKKRVISKNLSHYFYKNFKQSKKPLNVPECILLASKNIRAAYLAGLLDSDGSTKNRPTTLISNVYNDFLRQVQAVYSSLGIITKLKLRKEADGNDQAKWELCLVGDFAIEKFNSIVQKYAVKTLPEHQHSSGNDFGYPSEWITNDKVDYGKSWSRDSLQMTHNRAVICGAKVNNLVPVEVLMIVDEGIECETYDLSVPDRSEFVAQGMLVHNTAEIAFGEADDNDYCSMKNPTATLLDEDLDEWNIVTSRLYSLGKYNAETSDFSGAIPDERLRPAIKTWNGLNHHRWASNNSIFASVGMDYTNVGKQIAVNGEPGIMWLDNMRDYGRMIDGKQPGIDGRVKGGNPCFAGNVRLLTEHGYISMYDRWVGGGCQEYSGTDDSLSKYGSQKIINKNGLVEASNVYRTGTQVPVFRVTFDDNASIDLTDNHNMIVLVRHSSKKKGRTKYVEERKMVNELSVGDMIPLNQVSHFGHYHDPAYAELAGWVIGDGSLSPKKDGQTRAECTCYETDCIDVLPRISGLLHETYLNHNKSTNQNPAYAGWTREHNYFEHWEERVGSNVLGRLLVADGLRSGDKHRIPFSIWNSTRETVAAFLKGFASADGFVLINEKKKTISVRIRQSNERLLQDCRLLLNQFGIASSVHLRAEESQQMMNDGKGSQKLYNRKSSHELIISGIKQVRSFLNQIGFIQDWKTVEARKWLLNHHGSHNSDTGNYVKVKSIDYVGVEDTYCLTEPANNRVVVEGYEVGQCLEQSLESYELCNLVESFPCNHEDSEDYMRTLKFAYLYAKTVTLLPTHNARTNQVTLRNRRIGLSQSGIIQSFEKFGRRAVLSDFCDAGYNEIRRWDAIYSDWLCVNKSIKTTSVKPSGCRPWHALTTTSVGILSLEEMFELSGHQIADEWSDVSEHVEAVQYSDGVGGLTDSGQVMLQAIGDRITKTYDNGISDTVIVRLSHNIELESTPNHRWYVSHTYTRNRKQRLQEFGDWKRADELTEDDVVQITPGIYTSYEHYILKNLQSRHVVMRGGGSYTILQPQRMNQDLAWLLGYMWGDGSQSFSKFRMRYSDEHLFNLHKAQRIILDQFGVETKIHPASQGRQSYVLEIGSKQLWHWLLINGCLKIKSNADLIPKCVRSSSHIDIISFLAGLCDSDGCIGRRSNDQYAIISMSGKLFAKHVQDVALAVGIVFSRSHNTQGSNYQKTKSMWSLSSMQSTIKDRFEYFKKYCNKAIEHTNNKPWSHETDRNSRILGKVISVRPGEQQRTYDVEVENSHWYYAGAIKSHNTVSLLAGVHPGIHHPEARAYWRRVRIAKDSVLVKILSEAGFHIEPASSDSDRTLIVKFAVDDSRVRPVEEVSIWEQMQNVVDYQRYWADNQVSCTVKFKDNEKDDIARVLSAYEDQLKGISFLPHVGHGFHQAPYEPCTSEEVREYNSKIKDTDYTDYIYEAVGSVCCDNDKCSI